MGISGNLDDISVAEIGIFGNLDRIPLCRNGYFWEFGLMSHCAEMGIFGNFDSSPFFEKWVFLRIWAASPFSGCHF